MTTCKKQRNLPIHPPIIERKCRFGTCDEPLAYVINGVDLCYVHGLEQMHSIAQQQINELEESKQLELVK